MTNGTANGVTASDLATFTELVARHQAMAFGYALAILRDVDSAQDATQEAFVAAYFGLGSLADRDKFPQWLRGIVRHQCWRLLRRRELATAPLESASAIVAPGITPEQWCVEQEATERDHRGARGSAGTSTPDRHPLLSARAPAARDRHNPQAPQDNRQ